jgi:non-homologous end joining protein Ku
MARAIWSGVLTFGLVSVPVELYSATEAHGPVFSPVRERHRGRSVAGTQLASANSVVDRGYAVDRGYPRPPDQPQSPDPPR